MSHYPQETCTAIARTASAGLRSIAEAFGALPDGTTIPPMIVSLSAELAACAVGAGALTFTETTSMWAKQAEKPGGLSTDFTPASFADFNRQIAARVDAALSRMDAPMPATMRLVPDALPNDEAVTTPAVRVLYQCGPLNLDARCTGAIVVLPTLDDAGQPQVRVLASGENDAQVAVMLAAAQVHILRRYGPDVMRQAVNAVGIIEARPEAT